MKPWHLLVVACCSSLGLAGDLDPGGPPVGLDRAGMGRDLHGWTGGMARFAQNGATFQVAEPVVETRPDGGQRVATEIREMRRGTPVLIAMLEADVSPAGVIETLQLSGTVDGRRFDTGREVRPEPVEPAAAGTTAPATVPTLSPEAALQQGLLDRFEAAVERAQASDQVVKRDLAARLFAVPASTPDQLRPGLAAVLQSLFRRVGKPL